MSNVISLNLGKGIVVSVDKERLAKFPAIMTHAVNIGLKNILQDSHAAFTKKDFPDTYARLSRETVDRKLAALYNGELRVNAPTMNVEDIKAAMTLDELKAEIAKREKAVKKSA
jgi:non-homologous end joining protein Ku